MKAVKKFLVILSIGFALSMTNPPEAAGQCPMCRMSAEQNLKMGGTAGKGLNRGILFMLAMPYLIVGTMGVIWMRNRKKEEEL